MLKFRCQHCGRRVAVPSRNLGRLVTCAECGQQTHPLAEQIAAAGPTRSEPTTAPAAAPSPASPGPCDNCGVPIGKLQTTYAWDGHSVCGGCYHRLSGESGLVAHGAPPRGATAVVTTTPVVTRARAEPAGEYGPTTAPARPLGLELRERVLRALIVFVVASVALYGALSLLRDVAGLIAVAAVAVLALLALYALFRGAVARRRGAAVTALVPRGAESIANR